MTTREYAKTRLSTEPPTGCPFKVGDRVTFTNPAGIPFPGLTVIGFSKNDPDFRPGKYIHLDFSCYWFPVGIEDIKPS